MEDLIGRTIGGRYRVEAFIGKGGMAEVYKVWDQNRSVYLAMKILHADLAEDKVFLRRFRREAQTLSKLEHPNIVRFYGMEQDGDLIFLLMDYVEGTTLRKEIFQVKGPFTMERILEVMRPVCAALYYAHKSGYVHCDVKPANIMVHKNGVIFVSDFGIARVTEAATMTMVGAGTPAYMAPELASGENPVPQSDIYALGIILFEMLTGGERPFTGENAKTTGSTSEKVRWEQMRLAAPPPSKFNPKVSKKLDEIVLRCLEKLPADRYLSVLDFLNDLAYQPVQPKSTSLPKPVRTKNVPLPKPVSPLPSPEPPKVMLEEPLDVDKPPSSDKVSESEQIIPKPASKPIRKFAWVFGLIGIVLLAGFFMLNGRQNGIRNLATPVQALELHATATATAPQNISTATKTHTFNLVMTKLGAGTAGFNLSEGPNSCDLAVINLKGYEGYQTLLGGCKFGIVNGSTLKLDVSGLELNYLSPFVPGDIPPDLAAQISPASVLSGRVICGPADAPLGQVSGYCGFVIVLKNGSKNTVLVTMISQLPATKTPVPTSTKTPVPTKVKKGGKGGGSGGGNNPPGDGGCGNDCTEPGG